MTNPMDPEIRLLKEKRLVGVNLRMSLVNNRTAELWKRFMPMLPKVPARKGNELFSLQVYSEDYFTKFSPQAEFEKWALCEVTDFENVLADLETFTLNSGSYAVFHYKGAAGDASVFEFIYTKWLPSSGYHLDNRPHFEVLGGRYNNINNESEEEIWIPIK